MDKKKKIIYSIVIIIITLGLVGLSFYLGTQINKFTDNPKENEQENSEKVENSNKEDESKEEAQPNGNDENKEEVELDKKDENKEENSLDGDNENTDKPYKNKNYTFVKEYEEEITLNNKKHTIVTYYYDDYYGEKDVSYNRIIRKEVYMDKNLIFNEPIIDYTYCCESPQNSLLKEIENYHNKYSKYLKIKDSLEKNKEYLVLRNLKDIEEFLAEGNEETITIVKDDGHIIKQYKSTSPFTYIEIKAKDEAIGDRNSDNKVLYKDSFVDIHDNYLYYISFATCKLEEYRVVIQNGYTSETHTRTYYDGNEETEYGRTILAGSLLC